MVSAHEDPGDLHGFCGGRDAALKDCHCPDYEIRTRIRHPYETRWHCACCELPLDRSQLEAYRLST